MTDTFVFFKVCHLAIFIYLLVGEDANKLIYNYNAKYCDIEDYQRIMCHHFLLLFFKNDYRHDDVAHDGITFQK